jgi:hypothetical protein
VSIADYAHHNEEAAIVWWHEEGKPIRDHDYDYEPQDVGAADSFAEECAEMETDALRALLEDADYCARWPKAVKVIEFELAERDE